MPIPRAILLWLRGPGAGPSRNPSRKEEKHRKGKKEGKGYIQVGRIIAFFGTVCDLQRYLILSPGLPMNHRQDATSREQHYCFSQWHISSFEKEGLQSYFPYAYVDI
jgi:hypothetical protein